MEPVRHIVVDFVDLMETGDDETQSLVNSLEDLSEKWREGSYNFPSQEIVLPQPLP